MALSGHIDWHPYGHTRDQCVMANIFRPHREPLDPKVPLRDLHKRALVAALNGLEGGGTPDLPRLLRRFLEADDPDIRAAAVRALPLVEDPMLDTQLLQLLHDPVWRVRNSSARALLRRPTEILAHLGLQREHLLAYAYLREWEPDWARLLELGEAARPVLHQARSASDGCVRAAGVEILAYLDQLADQTSAQPGAFG
jgi:hypothetical protein